MAVNSINAENCVDPILAFMKYCTVCKAKYEDSVSFCPVDGEVLEDDPSSIVNTVLDGQYQVESMLGKGGMGAVYRARHILLGDRVAIKILPPEVRNNAEWLRRFRREGQAARRFRHPNSVTVYDLRTAGDGTIYMVMEYVEGHTLDAEIKQRGRFSPAEAFAILEPVLSVLNTAHSMGVVHRDLKPDNIMIGKGSNDGEPVVKLLDLGIAKMREIAGADNAGTTALTTAGQVLGTPYYMSPEQWGELPRDGNSEIDGRADIYSLGLVFYEMITGRRTYSKSTLPELRRDHLYTPPQPLHEALPTVSRAFSDAIARAVAKDRGDRQSTAGELAGELRVALKEEPPAAGVDRTLVDFPLAGSSSQTGSIPEASQTQSDVNAPTIITLDATPTSGVVSPATTPADKKPSITDQSLEKPQAASPQPIGMSPAAAPTIAESAQIQSSVTIPQTRTPSPVVEPKRSKALLLVAAIMFVVLIGIGVGGFFIYSRMRTNSSNTAGVNEKTSNNEPNTGNNSVTELTRYWLELMPSAPGTSPVRIAGVVPLASGQSFQFHFKLNQDGYLYILGPGEQNRLTAFLTNKPAAISGLTSNQVSKGSEFSFPSGADNFLTLDKKPGTEDYTVIFSAKQLLSPAVLNKEVTGKSLNDEEQRELTALLAQYRTHAPTTQVNDQNGTEPFVAVKLPQASNPGDPIVFVIRIVHK